MPSAMLLNIDLANWQETIKTLQAYCDVLKAVCSHLKPAQWHNSHHYLRVNANSISSGPIPCSESESEHLFDIELVVPKHICQVRFSSGQIYTISLNSLSPLKLYASIVNFLRIHNEPIRLNPKQFSKDSMNYDTSQADIFWSLMGFSYARMLHAQSLSSLQCDPLHIHLDPLGLIFRQYSGRLVPNTEGTDYLQRYEHISFGLSFGEEQHPQPYYFCALYPSQKEFSQTAADAAYWQFKPWPAGILEYSQMQKSTNPSKTLDVFFKAYADSFQQILNSNQQ